MVIVLILLRILENRAHAQPLTLTDAEHVAVLGHMQHLRDDSDELTIDDIQTLPLQPLPAYESPNFGFDQAAHWFSFVVKNTSSDPNWLLEVPFSALDQVDLYVLYPNNKLVHKKAGDKYPISLRDVPHQHIVFRLQLPPRTAASVYLRIKSTSSLQVPVHLWHEESFFRESGNIQIINGIFYGAMLLMALYQLFLYLSTLERVTLYYVFTLLAMTNILAYFQGYTFLYFHPESPWLNDIFAAVNGPLFVLFSTLLTRNFLHLPRNNRWLDDFLMTNMGLDLIAGALMLIFYGKISYEYHYYFILMHCAVAIISAGYCAYRKYQPAVYYLISWITLLTATLAFTVSYLGLAPGYLSTNYIGLMTGCLLQVLFISFAFAQRWNEVMKENQKAKEAELRRRQEEKERLEREVQMRVEEIHQKNEKLEEVNRVKDKLFSIVSHDIKGPLGSLQITLSLMRAGQIQQDEFKVLAEALESRFSHTTEFIENLLQWASLQMKGIAFNPECVDLQRIAEETLSLLDFDIKQKKIDVHNELSQPLLVYADLNMVRSVFRNLLTNAVKFTRKGGEIKLSMSPGEKYMTIKVSDTGVGISPQHRNKIFTLDSTTTPGTRQEKGTGLGLLLCKEFIDMNKGHIWFDSEVDKGTTFYFTLPEYIPAEAINEPADTRDQRH